jgi:hypothetical protein
VALGLPVFLVAPDDASAAGDRQYCCWKIDVRAGGNFLATSAARLFHDQETYPGFHAPGDIEGTSFFDWIGASRGLYSYSESGRSREPQFNNLFAGRRSFGRAAKYRLQFKEGGRQCEMRGISTNESGETSQECRPPPNQPCESSEERPWDDGSGVQLFGRVGARKLTVDVIPNFPAGQECALRGHLPSDLRAHGMEGPGDYTFAPPRTTGAKLRGRRDFVLTPNPFRTTRDVQEEQPHGVEGTATVKVTFTYFKKLRLRRERRALKALR